MGILRSFTDGLKNVVANLGTGRDKASHTEYVDRILTPAQLLTAYRNAWLPEKIVNYPAEDATRKWRRWQADPDQISKLEAEEKRLGLQSKTLDALKAARLWGGAALYINTGATMQSRPLAPTEKVRSLVVLTCLTLRAGETVRDIDSPYYGKPEFYKLRTQGAAEVEIHASRLCIFHGRSLPADADQAGAFSSQSWGDSVLQSTYDAIMQLDGTMANIASLVFESKVDVLKVEGFADMLAANQDSVLMSRASLTAAMKGINGMMMIDAKDDYQQKSASFASLPEIVGKLQDSVSGACGIPVTRLYGRAAVGLSGSGDGDERVYYDRVTLRQTTEIEPALAPLDECIIHAALGSRPPEVFYNWAPLRQMTESERAEIFSKTATAARAIAGNTSGEILPMDALSASLANELTELGVLPGLEQQIEEFGGLREQGLGTENEDFADASPRTLYVYRPVTNAADIIKHYADQGVDGMLEAKDLHVTVTYSRQPVDWMKMGESWQSEIEVAAGGARLMEAFGPQNDTLVLAFSSSDLSWRHEGMKQAGASWDWPEYQPHITIANGFDGEIKAVDPWVGEIKLGPEIFEEVRE